MPKDAPSVREDTRLPHVRMALSRKQAMGFFNERILPQVLPGRTLTDLSQRRIRYKPGKECRVHYRLMFAPEGDERPLYQSVTITFRRDSAELQDVAKRAPAANGAMSGKTVFVAEYSCLVQFFPADWQLPSLARAADADAMALQLGSVGGALAGSRINRVRVARYRPGFTCVLGYILEPESGGKTFEVMGKVYPGDDEAAEMRRKLRTLSAQAAPLGLTIPMPLDVAQNDGLVLMEKVPGANMDRQLLATECEEAAAPLVDLAARALANFHCLHLDAAPPRPLDRYFRRLDQRLQRIRRVSPELGTRAAGLLDALDLDAIASSVGATTLVHGDYKPNQLLVHEGRAALVDLDRVGIGDPAMDVGNFMAVLHKKALVNGQTHFTPLAERFLERYLEARPDEATARRAQLFLGVALVRMVLAKFERSPRSYARQGPKWSWLAVLDEAERCLAAT